MPPRATSSSPCSPIGLKGRTRWIPRTGWSCAEGSVRSPDSGATCGRHGRAAAPGQEQDRCGGQDRRPHLAAHVAPDHGHCQRGARQQGPVQCSGARTSNPEAAELGTFGSRRLWSHAYRRLPRTELSDPGSHTRLQTRIRLRRVRPTVQRRPSQTVSRVDGGRLSTTPPPSGGPAIWARASQRARGRAQLWDSRSGPRAAPAQQGAERGL